MIRLFFYALLFFVVWRILRSFGALFNSPRRDPPPAAKEKKTQQDLSNIQDAEFEDITNKKETGEAKTPPK